MATLVASGLLTVNDAAMKQVVIDHPIGQAVFLRAAFVALLLFAVSRFRPIAAAGAADGRKQRIRWRIWISGALLAVPLFLFITSLRYLPFADAIILVYLSPMVVAAMSQLIGETVNWRHWLAVLGGFVGAAMVMGTKDLSANPFYFLPVTVAVFVALRDLHLRQILASEEPLELIFVANLLILGLAAATLPFAWDVIEAREVGLLALAGVCFLTAQFLFIEALRYGEAVLVSGLKYSSLPWALVIGYLVWGQFPDSLALLGGLLIVASGLALLRLSLRRKLF